MKVNAVEKKSALWNPWHGCHKLSEGCRHCYVYRGDARRNIDSSVITQTKSFDAPIKRKRNGEYKIPSGTLVTPALRPISLWKMPIRGAPIPGR